MSNINEMNSPNQMRIMMKRMRDGEKGYMVESPNTAKSNMSVQDMMKITRNLQENINERPNVSRDTSDLSGEKLIKSSYNELNSDISKLHTHNEIPL
jgi:predicted Abi (CAAX) family protease